MPRTKPIYSTPNLGIQVLREYEPSSRLGYIACYVIPHPCVQGVVVLRSRLRMTDKLGRKLTSDEIIHHKNENKTDDSLENLELTTRTEHNQHHKVGVKQSKSCVEKRNAGMRKAWARGAFAHISNAGESSPAAKLKWEQVLEIRRLRASGRTNGEVAAMFNVSVPTISMIHNNRIWKKPR